MDNDTLDKMFSSIWENALIEKLETDLKELTEKFATLTERVATLEKALSYGQSFSGYVSLPNTCPLYVGDVKLGDIELDNLIQIHPSGDFYTPDPSVRITVNEYTDRTRHTYEALGQNSTHPLSDIEGGERR